MAAIPLWISATARCPSSRTPGPPRVLATTLTRPSPAQCLPTKETGHRTPGPPRPRPSAVARRLRICAVVNTTNPDSIKCHCQYLRINNPASSLHSTLVTPHRTRRQSASSISGSATGVCGMRDLQGKNSKHGHGRWPRLRIWIWGHKSHDELLKDTRVNQS